MRCTRVCRQSLVTIIANILTLNLGIATTWTSPNNPKLEDPLMLDTPLDQIPSFEEISWIGPIVPLGAAISPYFAAPFARKFGRKKVMLSTAIIFMAAYLIFGFGKSIMLIYVGRLLQGFGLGFNISILPMYIGEISQDFDRGPLGSLMLVFFNLGGLFTLATGPFVSYITFNFICLIFPIIFVILFAFMPESPFDSSLRGDTETTVKSLKFLRCIADQQSIMEAVEEIKKIIEMRADQNGSWSDLFRTKGNLKALTIGIGLMWVLQFSGINPVQMYSQTIFKKAGGVIEPEISSIIIGATLLIGNLCSVFAIDWWGRKVCLNMSTVGMIIATGVLGLYFYMNTEKLSIIDSLAFLPVTSLMLYIIMFSIGMGPIPWVITSEIFPVDVKCSASMLLSSICYFFSFLITKFFTMVDAAFGTHWIFWLFTICLLIGIVFIYFCVIETKDLSFEQIQRKLNES